ncbi:hypothetical protein [Rhodobium gokarnense]|uniref:Uncharacterized protein n=1 Tax=Rhodobium gokarnense TaxID=364296 RepID=A0ABT3HH62_9HYPH|nr:hypothetical protein [Rhodobium gokarnense]MCW2309733.1 hypothetical protein [Rhodobium gokarnense]
MNNPYFVFTMARSKSSWVTATVIDAVGAWVGSCSGTVEGYPRGQLENRKIFELQRSWFGRGWEMADAGRTIVARPGWRSAVLWTMKGDGYTGGPWVYKVSALYWRPFMASFPEARPITVRRDKAGILASAKRHGGNIASDKVLDAHVRALDEIEANFDAFSCNPSADPGDIERLKEWLARS